MLVGSLEEGAGTKASVGRKPNLSLVGRDGVAGRH